MGFIVFCRSPPLASGVDSSTDYNGCYCILSLSAARVPLASGVDSSTDYNGFYCILSLSAARGGHGESHADARVAEH